MRGAAHLLLKSLAKEKVLGKGCSGPYGQCQLQSVQSTGVPDRFSCWENLLLTISQRTFGTSDFFCDQNMIPLLCFFFSPTVMEQREIDSCRPTVAEIVQGPPTPLLVFSQLWLRVYIEHFLQTFYK